VTWAWADVLLTLAVFACALSFTVLLTAFIQWKLRSITDYTEAGRAICLAAFGKELPRRFSVLVSDAPKGPSQLERRLGASYILGTCDEMFKIIELHRNRLAYCNASEWRTMVHECLHALQPKRKHGNAREMREFELIVSAGMSNLWKEVGKCDAGAVTQGHGTRSTPAPGARLTGLTVLPPPP
jgi:hypothetical protein